jgi:hypothetical protein
MDVGVHAAGAMMLATVGIGAFAFAAALARAHQRRSRDLLRARLARLVRTPVGLPVPASCWPGRPTAASRALPPPRLTLEELLAKPPFAVLEASEEILPDLRTADDLLPLWPTPADRETVAVAGAPGHTRLRRGSRVLTFS